MVRASAGGVVVGQDGKMLLVEQHGNTWSLPKGGIEDGELPRVAAEREIEEETGLSELTYLGDLGTYERYSINRAGTGELIELGLRPRTFYLFTTTQTDVRPQDSEVTQVRWVTFKEAVEHLTHKKDKEFLQSSYEKIYALLQGSNFELH